MRSPVLCGVVAAVALFTLLVPSPALAQSGDYETVVSLGVSDLFRIDLDGDGQTEFGDFDGDGIPELTDILNDEPLPGDGGQAAFTAQLVAATEAANQMGNQLTGDCSGIIVTLDGAGEILDVVVGDSASGGLIDVFGEGAGNTGLSSTNPLAIESQGKIIYAGRVPASAVEPSPTTWSVRLAGLGLHEGSTDNLEGNDRVTTIIDLNRQIGTIGRFTGVFPAAGSLDADNGLSCELDGWADVGGAFPLFTVPGLLGAVLLFGGGYGLMSAARPEIMWQS